jgi:bifunctional DNA-binding transcriptional regulator/antitoxin component of YhaV-PrlF toxin-antitoxin module
MTVTVRNVSKTPLVVPPSIRRRAGHKNGEDLEFRVSGGVITILPKPPAAADEYTPAQRRAVDAQLAEGLADIKAGRTHGPFRTHREMIDFLHAQVKKAGPKAKRRKAA